VIDCLDGTPNPTRLRRALACFATGVAVVTTCHQGKREGLTVNSFSSVSLDPPLVLWSLQRRAASFGSFVSSGRFAVNVLDASQRRLSAHFARPHHDKFDGLTFVDGLGNCPVLHDSLAWFECRTESAVEGGDHMVFIGRVERAGFREGSPLVFSRGTYCVPEELRE
jgi:flavin reductase (DIM6/NTAB) family NADH-FMN oxidoreductase RutF